jgi:PTH1 family peptidyl-tRNA hydrolase
LSIAPLTDSTVQLIVGLGNPGSQYLKTRHNAGFWLLNQIAEQFGGAFRAEAKYKGDLAKVTIDNHSVWLLKPMTFMNKSGESIAPLAHFYKIPPSAILIAHDELDLLPGTVRLKRGGGHGGHNGLRDAVRTLGNSDFPRVRLGIGHPGHAAAVVGYVLRAAPADEQQSLMDGINAVLAELPRIISGDSDAWAKAMTALHSRPR